MLRGHEDWIWSATFSLDGTRVVTTSRDNTVRIWSADGSGESVVLGQHTDDVLTGVLGYDAARIAELRESKLLY